MELKDYQQRVDAWILGIGKGYFPPLSMLAQMTEEMGEIARVVNRTYGSQKPKESDKDKDLADELAGMLFAMACLANVADIDLGDALERHLAKISKRDAHRF